MPAADLYTKVVLTVIALCLVILVVRGESPVAHAAGGPVECKLVGVGSGVRVPVEIEKVDVRAIPVEAADSFRGLPVRVTNAKEIGK